MISKRGTFLTIFGLLIYTTRASYYPGYETMLSLVNQARSSAGLKSLCGSDKLMKSATAQASYCVEINQMSHGGPTPLMSRFTNQGFTPLAVAENLGETPGTDVKVVFDAWMADPPHKANILGPSFTHFGSAMLKGKDGKYFWAQHFAQASNSNEPCMTGGPTNGGSAEPSPTPKSTSPMGTPSTLPTAPSTAPAPSLSPPQSQQQQKQQSNSAPPASAPSAGSTSMSRPPVPGSPLTLNVRAPSQGPQIICMQGVCYQMVDNEFGRGFVPAGYPPSNMDTQAGPVFV